MSMFILIVIFVHLSLSEGYILVGINLYNLYI